MQFTVSSVFKSTSNFLHKKHSVTIPVFFMFFFTLFRLIAFAICGHFVSIDNLFIITLILKYKYKFIYICILFSTFYRHKLIEFVML